MEQQRERQLHAQQQAEQLEQQLADERQMHAQQLAEKEHELERLRLQHAHEMQLQKDAHQTRQLEAREQEQLAHLGDYTPKFSDHGGRYLACAMRLTPSMRNV